MSILKGLTPVVALAFISSIFTLSEGATWCMANPLRPEANHQKDIDALCGAVGVDCSQINQGGPCFQPNHVKFHASVVFNQYYQARMDKNSCNFGGVALLTSDDPSTTTCWLPHAA